MMPSAAHSHTFLGSRRLGRGLLTAALLVAILTGARGITDEGAVVVGADMARYLMDGVFLHDLLGSGAGWTLGGAITYAEHYFVQYPALSIPHHPPLLPVSLVPFYGVFGVTVFAARLAILAYFIVAILLLYTLVERVYDDEVAGWACLLFASSPIVALFAQRVLSEIPTIAMVLAALNALVRFCESGKFRYYILFGVCAIGSLAFRQLAAFMWPAYVALLLTRGGRSRLARWDVVVTTVSGALIVVVIAIATWVSSPFNVAVVLDVLSQHLSMRSRLEALAPIARAHLRPALGVVMVAGLLMALQRRDRRVMVAVFWIGSVLACVLLITGPVEPARYSILAVPAYCVCGASLVRAARSMAVYRLVVAVLAVAVMWQLWAALATRPGSDGRAYEEAARFVLADTVGAAAPTVLYSASLDTGAFVFFVRKHDPERRLVVLRADKLLTTSLMGQVSVEDRIHSADQIYPLLDRYGTRFIVIEDRPSGSVVLDWLRTELTGDRFIERRRIGGGRSHSLPGGSSLVVYEYKGARPADPDAEIDMRLPLIGRELRVRLSELRPAVAR